MRKAKVYMHDVFAGFLVEYENGGGYQFSYDSNYDGPPISLTMPTENRTYTFKNFPPFFEGLLPEGIMLEGLLRQRKLDSSDYFGQLTAVGEDLIGAVTVIPDRDE